MNITSLTAAARVDDQAALAALLQPIANREQLRVMLRTGEPGRAQEYDAATRTGRIVAFDGSTVECYTVTDITLQQYAEIATACDDIRAWGYRAFQEAVERALGGEFHSVQ